MGTAPQPAMENVNRGSAGRPFSVTDALNHLDAIKVQFRARFDRYNILLDIMKDFESEE